MDMKSLSEGTWDLVICGTGLRQSLLALALSRSGKKILHIDRNNYYGGTEAAFSLQEASTWINDAQTIKCPTTTIEPVSLYTQSHSDQLGTSRSYTLTLSPHLIYSRSALLPALISSRLHTQLEFQAVGSWWIYQAGSPVVIEHGPNDSEAKASTDGQVVSHSPPKSTLQKIPSSREDVFADNTLAPRDKRSLMKFLRSLLSEPTSEAEQHKDELLADTLSIQFRIEPSLHRPLLALSLCYDSAKVVKTGSAVSRIRRHLRSIGTFGPGFGAVMPKYGGGAEIAQVACRASAVGGAVYVLGRGLNKIRNLDGMLMDEQTSTSEFAHLELSDGGKIKARFVAGCTEDIPDDVGPEPSNTNSNLARMAHSISIIASPLEHLFSLTSDGGPVSAGAVVVRMGDDQSTTPHPGSSSETWPIYMIIHSSDSGECPSGQCVIYASTLCNADGPDQATERLEDAVSGLLSASTSSDPKADLLWSMTYRSRGRPIGVEAGPIVSRMSGKVLVFPTPSVDLAFDDSILDSVREMWKRIMGDGVDEAVFLRSEA